MLTWLAERPKLELVAVFLALALAGAGGAWVSTKVRVGSVGVWATFAVNLIAIGTWAYQSKYSKMNLLYASFLFDLIYNLTWFIALLVLGETVGLKAGIGIGLVLLGLSLLA